MDMTTGSVWNKTIDSFLFLFAPRLRSFGVIYFLSAITSLFNQRRFEIKDVGPYRLKPSCSSSQRFLARKAVSQKEKKLGREQVLMGSRLVAMNSFDDVIKAHRLNETDHWWWNLLHRLLLFHCFLSVSGLFFTLTPSLFLSLCVCLSPSLSVILFVSFTRSLSLCLSDS